MSFRCIEDSARLFNINHFEVSMLRFFLNFIFFGVLFYAIHLFFPDAFQTLVSWAGSIYDFIVQIGTAIVNWVTQTAHAAAQNGIGEKQTLTALLIPIAKNS